MIHAIHANRIRPDKGSRSFSILGYIVMAAISRSVYFLSG